LKTLCLTAAPPEVKESYMEHNIWYDKAYLESVHPTHLPPKDVSSIGPVAPEVRA